MKQLFLADLKGMTDEEIRSHLTEEYEYEASKEDVDKYDILIAYESVGSWGCDSSSFFLLRERNTGELYENHGSHCSCYGFEGQFEPEVTTLEYLKSDNFYFCGGGYDDEEKSNKKAVKDWIVNNL